MLLASNLRKPSLAETCLPGASRRGLKPLRLKTRTVAVVRAKVATRVPLEATPPALPRNDRLRYPRIAASNVQAGDKMRYKMTLRVELSRKIEETRIPGRDGIDELILPCSPDDFPNMAKLVGEKELPPSPSPFASFRRELARVRVAFLPPKDRMAQPTLVIQNARIPSDATKSELCDIQCYADGHWTVSPASPKPTSSTSASSSKGPFSSSSTLEEQDGIVTIDAADNVLLPGGLVHPHLHLDKCFLMDRCELKDGSFKEALAVTSEAKRHFTEPDLIERGTRLIRDSISHGVTTMRVHVEVDPTVNLLCLSSGLHLLSLFSTSCSLQLVAFAQDPFFPSSPSTRSTMHSLFSSVAELCEKEPGKIKAIGSAPYVESNRENAIANIEMTFRLAKRVGVDVDFHLDYDLDQSSPALVWEVLRIARENTWEVEGRPRRITLGHCTKLSVFTDAEFDRLAEEVRELRDEVSFVALPPSDLYMQGRETEYGKRSRATFPALELVRRGIPCCVGVNNIENAFTPQGNFDPLGLLPLLVGIWQSATPSTLWSLLEMVTTSASLASGVSPSSVSEIVSGEGVGKANFVLLDGNKDVRSAVLAPSLGRITIYDGKVVGRRTVDSFVMEGKKSG